jgi:signal peptidase I
MIFLDNDKTLGAAKDTESEEPAKEAIAENTEAEASVLEISKPTENEAQGAPKKKKSKAKSLKKIKAVESPEDAEIASDIYNLYLESFSRASEDSEAVDVFTAIEKTLPEEEILPNTAFVDTEKDDQIAFSDNYEEFEDIDDEAPDLIEKENTLPPYNAKNPRKIDGRFDFAELFIFTLIAVMILTSFIFRHSIVEGSSMQNTLQSGEHLIISDVFYTPKRGDVIVCEDYSTGIRKPIVKRVIAVGGDEIRITRDGNVYVNGELLVEDYVFLDGEPFYPSLKMTVPEGTIYVMGDHRNASTDSRQVGVIDEDTVLGKVLIRFYPFDKFGTVD